MTKSEVRSQCYFITQAEHEENCWLLKNVSFKTSKWSQLVRKAALKMTHLNERWPNETEMKEMKVLGIILVLEVTYKSSVNTGRGNTWNSNTWYSRYKRWVPFQDGMCSHLSLLIMFTRISILNAVKGLSHDILIFLL